MDHQLLDAAKRGDIRMLYSILRQDPNILKTMDETAQMVETPLHVAASSNGTIKGVEFAIEVSILMPSFMKKLNPDGHTPLHLALIYRNFKTARALVRIDADLIRVRGEGSKTPLHIAAEQGMPRILFEFLSICPSSVGDLTAREETIAHLAVRNGNFFTYRVLRHWLKLCNKDVKYLLNLKDIEGDTVLHIATRKNDTQMARNFVKYVDRDAVNFYGDTALDIYREASQPGDNKILESILRGSASTWKSVATGFVIKLYKGLFESPGGILDDKSREVILVVGILIATATYQGILTPSGFWLNGTLADSNSSSSSGMTMNVTMHSAGRMIMTDKDQDGYLLCNSITFLLSIIVIVACIPLTMHVASLLLTLSLTFLGVTYYNSFLYSITSSSVIGGFVKFLMYSVLVYVFMFLTWRVQMMITNANVNKRTTLQLLDIIGETEPRRRDDHLRIHPAVEHQSSHSVGSTIP